ncbi:MAG: 2OG-Fe(II) oxygenase, partial [Bdellovibrio sp.]
LVEKSWSVENDWATRSEGSAGRLEADAHVQGFRPAGLGGDKEYLPTVRSDRIFWLGEQDTCWPLVKTKLGDLQAELNRELFLGLDHFEAHFAVYEPGQFYAPHMDRSQLTPSKRAISFILYLNSNWTAEDEGELLIHEESEVTRVLPVGGRMVLFRSDTILHSVQSPKRPRYSLTAWFRTT